MESDKLPVLTPDEMAAIESKLVAQGLAAINGGTSPSQREMGAIERAAARYNEQQAATAESLAITELGFETVITTRLDQRGIHDGTRLLERKREVFIIIAKLLAQSVPIRDICDICGVSEHTVQSVAEHPAAELPAATQKGQFIAKLRLAASLGLEGLIARFKAGEVTGVEWGIVVDKLSLAEGGVTSRTEVIHADTTEEDEYTRVVREARQAHSLRAPSGMVIEAEEISPMAPAALPAPAQDAPKLHSMDS